VGKNPSVSIIVVNWNGGTDTLLCLKSLSAVNYPIFELLVVDNGSTDGSPILVRDQFPHVIVLRNQENLGFTGANNLGIRWAMNRGADYVLLLNNDTEVEPDFLRLMVAVTESDPTIGAAGPLIYYHSQPTIIWSAGGIIEWHGRTRMIELDQPDKGQLGKGHRRVDYVTGCALLIKTVVLSQVGLLDDRFFAYYEETELCYRIRQAGFKIVNVSESKIWHKIPLDKRDSSPQICYYMARNRLLYLKTTGASPLAWLYTVFAEYLRALVNWSLRPKWRSRKGHRKMMIRALLDAFLGRWGRCTIEPPG
jgi:GT2 family glycosyltransferase